MKYLILAILMALAAFALPALSAKASLFSGVKLKAGNFLAGLRQQFRTPYIIQAANDTVTIDDASVETHECSVRRTNDAAITARHLLWKKGATDGGVALNGATDCPLGTIDNTETGTGKGETILLLGRGPTKKMVASEAISAGEQVYTAANGQVQDTPTGASVYLVGTALTAALAAGDLLEVADCTPVPMTFA